jgi:hypothetical protein
MKKLSSFFICSCFICCSFSQTIDRLDKTNGFNIFNFGKAPNSIPDIKEGPVDPNQNVLKEYNYTGNDIKTYNGIPVYRITLYFYKNKLFQIYLALDKGKSDFTDTDHKIVMSALEANFGKRTATCDPLPEDYGEMLNCAIWDAKNIRLQYHHIIFHELNTVASYLFITEKNIEQKMKNEETK